jgi:hypothetical protein
LHKLQESNDDLFWDDHPDLLIWMLHIGGSFAPKGPTRSGFKALLQMNHTLRLETRCGSLPELLEILAQFIWSEKMYLAQIEEFWNDIHTKTWHYVVACRRIPGTNHGVLYLQPETEEILGQEWSQHYGIVAAIPSKVLNLQSVKVDDSSAHIGSVPVVMASGLHFEVDTKEANGFAPEAVAGAFL